MCVHMYMSACTGCMCVYLTYTALCTHVCAKPIHGCDNNVCTQVGSQQPQKLQMQSEGAAASHPQPGSMTQCVKVPPSLKHQESFPGPIPESELWG